MQRLYGWLRQPPDCPTEAPSSPIDTASPRCSLSKNGRRPAALPSSTTDRPSASGSTRWSIGLTGHGCQYGASILAGEKTNTDRQRTHEESRGRPKWSLAKYLQGPGRTPPQERDSEHEYDSCRCPRGSCCTMVCIAHGTPLHPPSLSPATNQPNRRLLLFRSLRLAIGLGVGQKEVYGTDRRDRYR